MEKSLYSNHYKQMTNQHKPIILILHLSIYALILFTAFNAYQNIITKIHEDQGDSSLGPYQLSINYVTMILANFITPAISKKLKPKYTIALSSLGYAFHYLMGFFMKGTSNFIKYVLAGLGAAVNGIFAALIWVGVGSYIHQICEYYSVIDQKGYYVGIFSGIYTFSTVAGAIFILIFRFQIFNQNIYFLMTSLIALLSFFYALIFLEELSKQKNHSQQLMKNESDKQIEEFLTNQQQASPSLITSQQANQTQSPKQKQQDQSLAKSLMALKDSYYTMRNLLPCILIDGINVGVSSSFMLHILPKIDDEKQDNLNAGYSLMGFGFGCVIGGFIGGKICDYIRAKSSIIVGMAIYTVCCVTFFIASFFKSLAFSIVCCLMWGLSMYYLQSAEMVVCSRLFEGKPESFAIVKQFHSVSMVGFFILSAITHNQLPVEYVMASLLIFAVPGFLGAARLPNDKIEAREDSKQ